MEKSFDERVSEAQNEVSAVIPQQANQRQVDGPNTLFIDPRDSADISSTTVTIPGTLNILLNELRERSVN